MTALASISDIANRLTGGNSGTPEHIWQWIDGRIQTLIATAPIAGRITDMWRYNKSNGANGSATPPTTAAICDRTTVGALGQTNPGGGRQKWLLGVEGVWNTQGTLILYDRLLHTGGYNATTDAGTPKDVQNGTGVVLTRNTGGVGNQIWVEIYSAIGTTGTTVTASYTNQAGTPGRTTKPALFGSAGANNAERILPLSLADGDTGVQSVETVTFAATTGTAGNWGVTIVRPFAIAQFGASGQAVIRDFISGLPSVPEITADMCISSAWLASSATIPSGLLGFHMIEA